MNTSIKLTVTVLVLGIIASANPAHAQVRDAGSKISGNYTQFDQPARNWSAPTFYVPQTAVARTADQPARVAEQPTTRRAFSYDVQQAPPCDTAQTAPAPQTARPSTGPQATRQFSYEPGYVAPQQRYVPSRGWQQSGVRDAGSKVRGDY